MALGNCVEHGRQLGAGHELDSLGLVGLGRWPARGLRVDLQAERRVGGQLAVLNRVAEQCPDRGNVLGDTGG
jgi:hypothetical protein